VNPYAAAATYEGTFQSNPGTGVSSTIGINFTPSVPSVTMTIYDPTYDGNTAQAFDSTGALLGSVNFVGTGTPGWDVPDTKTLTFSGIHTVILTPAAADYVSYDANFQGTPGPSPCPHAVLNGSPLITDFYGSQPSWRSIPHMGRDYDGQIGVPIFSEDWGVVAHSDSGSSSGWAIVVRSPDATSYYFHMSHRSPFNVGDTVQAGTQVGTIGNTGHVESSNGGNGAHLHFEQHLPGGPIWDSTGKVPKGTQFEPCTTPGEHT
jgi:murein DD-endopeptidase MepM/ murein hydrolase activator NlpD